jgi:dihydropyrimidinase
LSLLPSAVNRCKAHRGRKSVTAISSEPISRGKIAWTGGELRAKQGDGHYIERPPFSPVHVANSTWKEQTAPQAVRRSDVTP